MVGAALAAVPAAPAEAAPYLRIGEAKSALGRELHRSFEYGARTGSLLAFCGRRARHVVRCDVLFEDLDGDAWCGGARIIERCTYYVIRWNLSMRDCHLF
jgi:hypothetical protein